MCAIAALALSVCVQDAGSPAPGSSDRVLERTLAARVSEERMVDTVRTVVGFGPRMGGTPSGHRAAAWRAEAFAAMGLAVEVVEDGEVWCHWEESWSVVAHVADAEEATPLGSAWPYGFSPAAEGRVPLATDPRDGEAWLTRERTRPPRGGPQPAVVLYDGAGTADGRYAKIRSLRAGPSNPAPVFGLGTDDGARLRAWLEEGRAVELEFALASHVERARPRTVVATLAPREGAPPGHLLFCAHGDSDSGGPGANDNGSGEAIVMEIARVWSAAVAEGLLEPPPRAVRFALWGSEIHSSSRYRDRHAAGAHPVLAVVNFDQSGFGGGAEQLNVEPDDLAANAALVHLAVGILRDHAGVPGFPERWATNRSLGGTDSYVFSSSEAFRAGGRPALTLFTSAWDEPDEHRRTPGMPGESWSDRQLVRVDHDPWYHSGGDLPANTTDREPHNMGWCARVGLVAGLRWLQTIE